MHLFSENPEIKLNCLQHFEEKNEHIDNIGNKMKIIFKLTVNKNTSMTFFGSIFLFYSYTNNEYVEETPM